MDANDNKAADALIAFLERMLTSRGRTECIARLTSLQANFCPDGFINSHKDTADGPYFIDNWECITYQPLPDLFEALHGSDEQMVRDWLKSKLEEFAEAGAHIDKIRHATELGQVVEATVCSDVHLGTRWSHKDAFYRWLDSQSSRTIILLGDILDLWLYSRSLPTDTDLIRCVAHEWKKLWTKLAAATERKCTIHYIPGNHDGFTYFIESFRIDQSGDPWSSSVVLNAPVLDGIQAATEKYPLLAVAEMHYPLLMLDNLPRKILLTHGHFATLGWRLINGLREDIEIPAWLSSMSTLLAHKNVRRLRRLNNEKDWLYRTHAIEDRSVAVTNAVLVAYDGATALLQHHPDKFVRLVDTAMRIYFGTNPPPEDESGRVREALTFLQFAPRDHNPDLLKVRDDHVRLLQRSSSNSSNVTLKMKNGKLVRQYRPFSKLQRFDAMVFGHFHDPRNTAKEDIFDAGGYVDHIETSLDIRANGTLVRDTRPLPDAQPSAEAVPSIELKWQGSTRSHR